MTLNDFANEYDNFIPEVQQAKLRKFFEYILNDIEANYHLIGEILDIAMSLEADDYFGTEGFNL